ANAPKTEVVRLSSGQEVVGQGGFDRRKCHESREYHRQADAHHGAAAARERQRRRPRAHHRGDLELTTMTLTKPIKGIIGACLTPFDENDRVNYKALEKEIDFIVADCDAITIAAVEAAEYTMLSRDERKEVLKVATEMVNKRVPVILGCSSPSPKEVLELAEYSAKVGGDLVQVLMPLRPWGGQPTIAELMEFYTQVASASPLPVTCYHNPVPGADPPQDAFVKITEIENIRYLKDGTKDIT